MLPPVAIFELKIQENAFLRPRLPRPCSWFHGVALRQGEEGRKGEGGKEGKKRGGEGLPATYQMDLAYRFVMLRLDFYTQIVKPNAA